MPTTKRARGRWAVAYTGNLIRYFGFYRREKLMIASLIGLVNVWTGIVR